MNFAETMDQLGLTAAEAAEVFGLSVQTIRQMRQDPGSSGYRSPPTGWRKEFARIARNKGGALNRVASELDLEMAAIRHQELVPSYLRNLPAIDLHAYEQVARLQEVLDRSSFAKMQTLAQNVLLRTESQLDLLRWAQARPVHADAFVEPSFVTDARRFLDSMAPWTVEMASKANEAARALNDVISIVEPMRFNSLTADAIESFMVAVAAAPEGAGGEELAERVTAAVSSDLASKPAAEGISNDRIHQLVIGLLLIFLQIIATAVQDAHQAEAERASQETLIRKMSESIADAITVEMQRIRAEEAEVEGQSHGTEE